MYSVFREMIVVSDEFFDFGIFRVPDFWKNWKIFEKKSKKRKTLQCLALI